MTGDVHDALAAGYVDAQRRHRREDLGPVPLADEHLLQAVQGLRGVAARQHEGPPGNPQAHAERRLVGSVAAHVADQRLQRAVAEFDQVVEVAAEQCLVAARPVAQRVIEALVDQ